MLPTVDIVLMSHTVHIFWGNCGYIHFSVRMPFLSFVLRSNNSLLVSLNARGYIRGGARSQTGTASTSTSTTLDVIKLNGVRDRGLSDTQLESSRQAAIHITTDTVTDHDAYLVCGHFPPPSLRCTLTVIRRIIKRLKIGSDCAVVSILVPPILVLLKYLLFLSFLSFL